MGPLHKLLEVEVNGRNSMGRYAVHVFNVGSKRRHERIPNFDSHKEAGCHRPPSAQSLLKLLNTAFKGATRRGL